MENNRENEVKSWLQVALEKENLKNFDVNIVGNSEKGDGFVGDVIFTTVTGTDVHGVHKKYDLVLKCSKSSTTLMEKSPAFRESYFREIYLYEKVFPIFTQFQFDRGVKNPFDTIPKCYGVYNSESKQIVVMENLKQAGYDLWSNKKPLTRQHIELVMKEYGKFHAISVAMKEQEPKKFQQLADGFKTDIFRSFLEMSDFVNVMKKDIIESCKMLNGDLPETTLKKWAAFRAKLAFICYEMVPSHDDLQVIIHGDCWNNNFMYKYNDGENSTVSRVAMLDWQISKVSSPVLDLSYFLFSCISGEDINDMNEILKTYYDSFTNHLQQMGSNAANTHSFSKFLQEWQCFCKYGIMMCQLPLKVGFTEKKNLPDFEESAEKDEDISNSFSIQVTDQIGYKNRLKPIVQYAVESNLI